MGKFEINISEIKDAVQLEDSLVKEMDSLLNDLKDILNEMNKQQGTYTDILKALYTVQNDVQSETKSIQELKDSLGICVNIYENTENIILNQGKILEKKNTCVIFPNMENEDTYGGNQGGALDIWNNGTDEQKTMICDIIMKYNRYKDYTDDDIERLLTKLNSEGCGYTALMNTVISEYKDKPEEFEKKFGFPLYDENGKLNYSYLILDFYAATDNMYFVGNRAFEFRYEDYSSKDGNILNYNVVDDACGNGTDQYQRSSRFSHYLKGHEIEADYDTTGVLSMFGKEATLEECQEHINAGDYVAISVRASEDNVILFEDAGYGETKLDGEHVMLVTGTTGDGKIIVSSWGKKYYIDYSAIEDCSYVEYITYK